MSKNQNEQLSEFYKKAKIDYEIFNFTDKIIDYYSKANLVITRSGASVLGELINIKIPFISIPFQHQQIIINLKMLFIIKKRFWIFIR